MRSLKSAAVFLIVALAAGTGCTGTDSSQQAATVTPAVDPEPDPILTGECSSLQAKAVIHKILIKKVGDGSTRQYVATCPDGSSPAGLVKVKPGHLVAWKQDLSSSERVILAFPGANPLFGIQRPDVRLRLPYEEWSVYQIQSYASYSDEGVRHTYTVYVGDTAWNNDTGPKIVVEGP